MANTSLTAYEVKCMSMDKITKKLKVLQTVNFNLTDRYVVSNTRALGYGAYGVVCEATDKVTGKQVAIKRLSGFLDNYIDCMRTLREIKLLRAVSHPNVIKVFDILPVPADQEETFNEMYIVFEYMETSMKEVIKSSQDLTEEHFSFWMYQLLKGLKYLDSAGILHRDMKPENILLDADSNLKIADLGLSRMLADGDYTEYVVTRYYRAPEVICDRSTYTTKVDLWSAGTILAEILLRRVFLQGNDQVQQLALILMNIGSPTAEQIAAIKNGNARKYVERSPHHNRPDFHDLFPDASDAAVDLIEKILQWDPDARITLDECLAHPFVAQWRDVETETVYEGPKEELVWDFEDKMETMSKADKRKLFLEEIKYWEAKNAAP